MLTIIAISLILPTNLTHAPESERVPDLDDRPGGSISQETRLPPVTTKKKDHQKLESQLEQLVRSDAESLSKLDSMTHEKASNISDTETIQLVFELNRNATFDDLTLLEDRGAVVEITYKHFVQARVPLDLLYGMLDIPFVRYIRTPSRPVPTVISGGVEVINADDAHAFGYNGSGVKVAVIDLGFDVTNTEISGNIVEAVSFLNPPDIMRGGDSEHGTACAEIVLDVAPEAQLFLYNVGTDIEFSNAVDRAISQDVDIISVSLGWFNTPSDGTGFICDVIDNALSNGVLCVISAGNQAENHWEGTFRDDDLNGWHEFYGTDETNEFYAYAGNLIWITLTWDDWPTSDQDFDLYLYDDTMSVVVSSETSQDGTQSPMEYIWMYAPSSGTYHIAIDNYDSTRNVNFDLHTSGSYIDYYVRSSSILDPGTANGAFTVGATHVADDSLEGYSSRGPTNDGRLKPNIAGPAQVYTSAYGYGTFSGTSAATPHVAGAAAILLSANNSRSAVELMQILESTALDLGEPGPDYSFGYGRINLNYSYPYENRIIHVPGNYSTIQEAIDAAYADDTIIVGPGTYNENIIITKDLTIQSSEGASTTIIDGGGNDNCVSVTGSTVAFSNFTIMNSGDDTWDAGIRLDYSPNSTVVGNNITRVMNGVLAWHSEEGIAISNNTISNTGYIGIDLWKSSNVSISRNIILGNEDSIALEESNYNSISSNALWIIHKVYFAFTLIVHTCPQTGEKQTNASSEEENSY